MRSTIFHFDDSAWQVLPAGSMNQYGSEGPATLTKPRGLYKVPAGATVCLVNIAGGTIDKALGLPSKWLCTQETDVQAASYALITLAAKHMRVPME